MVKKLLYAVSRGDLICIGLIVALISAKPLLISAGDFLVYFKGTEQLLNQQEIYRVDFAPFGKRFFNGPVWGYFLSPFTLFSSEAALILFRTISLLISLTLVWKLSPGSREQKFWISSLFLLWFPSRMNMNLAQGAAIAGALALYVAFKLHGRNLTKTSMLLGSLALTLSVNFKPTLLVYFLSYLVLSKQLRFVIYFIVINLIILFTQVFFTPNATYLNWANLMIERNGRILEGDFSNLVGPWALIARATKMDPHIVGYFSLLVSGLILFLLFRNRNEGFDFQVSLLTLSVAVLVGPYSPAQDSLLLSILLVISITDFKQSLWSKVCFTFVSCLWTLSTEKSIIKSLVLLVVISYIIFKLFESLLLLLIHLFISLLLLAINQAITYDHITYDLAGLGTLIGCVCLLFHYYQSRKTLSQNSEIKRQK
jgi:hypothetical protein